ncbi:MAG: urease accessory protein UreD [Elainellaceae cyanobacterium]
MNEPCLSTVSTASSAAPSTASAWHGQLHLEFARRDDQTLLSHNYAQAPLKIQRPFYPEGQDVCHSVMLHTAGGIVGGDRLSVQVTLHPQAQALVTTAAAAKLYRSNGKEATQTIALSIAEGACLEWLPQETIVFDGACYRQNLRVELAANATWLGWEITRLGRSARGETFNRGTWRSHTEVWQAGRLLWFDPQWIEGSGEMLESEHGLGGYPVIGSFAFIGQPVSKEWVEKARSLWVRSETGSETGEVGVTRLMNGLLCRYRGHSTIEARQWFIQVWHLLRLSCMGRSGCIPRVWQLSPESLH